MNQKSDEPEGVVGSIGRQAGRGLRWSVVGNMVTKVASFAMGLVLARLLAPSDFGIYAIALAATQFVMHVNDAGIIAATVQWRGKLEDMAPTATTLAIVFSVGVYGLFWVLAPAFAELSGSESATPVVRLLTSIILVDGITAVRSAALLRRFEQDKLTKANMAGFVANAALAITLAANGAGAYSFAVGQVAASVVTGVVVFVSADLPFRTRVNRAIAGRLMWFGLPLAASLGIEAVLMNADYVIVGDVLGATALGFYLLAFNVSSWVPGVIGTAIRYVTVAAFSRLAEDDSESLAVGVRRSVPVLIASVLPVAVVMITLAHPVVTFLYGGQWAPSAGVLRFLAVLMVVRMLTALAFDILTSMGATRSTVWLNAGWAIALTAALLIGTRMDGIRGASIAHAVVGVLVAMPLAIYAVQRAGVDLRPIVPELVRPAIGAVVSGVLILLLTPLAGDVAFFQLALAGGVGLLCYILIVVPWAQLREFTGRAVQYIPARSR
jgi:O-antigen/teichoic acid export membrane protein